MSELMAEPTPGSTPGPTTGASATPGLATSGPVTVLIELHPVPGREDSVRDGLARALANATDPALLDGRVLTDTTDPTSVYAIQTWSSAELFHHHMDQAGGFAQLAAVLTEEPRVVVLTVHAAR